MTVFACYIFVSSHVPYNVHADNVNIHEFDLHFHLLSSQVQCTYAKHSVCL